MYLFLQATFSYPLQQLYMSNATMRCQFVIRQTGTAWGMMLWRNRLTCQAAR